MAVMYLKESTLLHSDIWHEHHEQTNLASAMIDCKLGPKGRLGAGLMFAQ